MEKSPMLFSFLMKIAAAGGRPYFVGGAVRDIVLEPTHPSTDIDVEVFGLHPEALAGVLERNAASVDLVGKAFGVFKVKLHDGTALDVSVPRRENKRGVGHKGFDVSPSPLMSPYEAVQRRDFTMNALMMDPFTGEINDPVQGEQDIRMWELRHVGPQFGEDPLRVLRGMQFASRFDMTMVKETVEMCKQLLPEARTLPVERVWVEWEKWSRGDKPSRGLVVLADTMWVLLYPELAALMLTPQDAEWHPEGNVWEHTKQAVDAAARITIGFPPESRSLAVFAALCHDIGKPDTTAWTVKPNEDQFHITSYGHAQHGAVVADKFLTSIGMPVAMRQQVVALVSEHMWGCEGSITPRGVRRLAHRLGKANVTVLDLVRLMEADQDARGKRAPDMTIVDAITEMADSLMVAVSAPQPILMGRHLIERNTPPGPAMGIILKRAFEAQLDGVFSDLDGAIAWLDSQMEV